MKKQNSLMAYMNQRNARQLNPDEPKGKTLKAEPTKMSRGPLDPKKTGRELTNQAKLAQEKRTQFLKDEAKRESAEGRADFIRKSVAGAVGALVAGRALANKNDN
jgi:hypothetical protein